MKSDAGGGFALRWARSVLASRYTFMQDPRQTGANPASTFWGLKFLRSGRDKTKVTNRVMLVAKTGSEPGGRPRNELARWCPDYNAYRLAWPHHAFRFAKAAIALLSGRWEEKVAMAMATGLKDSQCCPALRYHVIPGTKKGRKFRKKNSIFSLAES